MKKITKIGACALLASSLVASAFGQIQTAGTLFVNVDATVAPVGTLASLPNSGTLGGVFIASNSAVAGISPQIIALGGNGTRGVMLDGPQVYLTHFTAVGGTPVTLTAAAPGLVGVNPNFSVEAWMYKATVNNETGPVGWGTRTTAQNVSCNWGRSTAFGGFSWQGGGFDHGWATVPTAGAWHHLVWVYDNTAVGTNAGTISLYRDGVLDKAEVQGAPPSVNGGFNILIGGQHSGAVAPAGGTLNAAGVVGKVRIHDGVLTAAQVLNNYNFEVASFTNGTPATALAAAPYRRFSFNQPPTNNAIGLTVPDTGSFGGAAAVVRGNTLASTLAAPYFDGTQLVLPQYGTQTGASNGYVDLPNNILSSLSVSNGGPGAISIELWAEPTASANTWSELAYFGNSTIGEVAGTGGTFTGVNNLVIPCQVNTSQEQGGVRGNSGDRTINCYLIGGRKHIVITWDETNNVIKVYHQGIQVEQSTANIKMNAIVDLNNWLGRSGYSGDAQVSGNYREFRIFNRLLSASEIRRDFLVGPSDALDATQLTWNGNVNGTWDIASTANWLTNGVSTVFTNGSKVLLNDSATGTTTVSNNATLSVASISVENTTQNYTLTGGGNFTGTGGLTKFGSGTLTFAGPQTNDYTGVTLLGGGTVIVTNLANGGLPSALGAAGADPTNLVLRGGTLSYQGPTVTINRGFVVSEVASTIDAQSNLNIGGRVRSFPSGGLSKTGSSTLTISSGGSNLLSAGNFPGLNIIQGTVVLDGTAGGQTNRSMSEIFVGGGTNYGGNLIVSNATLYSDSWVNIGRGNGNIGNLSTLAMANGVITIAANGFAMGYNNGLPNLSSQLLTMNGSSSIFAPGELHVGESAGSSSTANLNNNSWIRISKMLVGISANSTGTVTIASSAIITNNANYTSIGTGVGASAGQGGVGVMVVKDNGAYYSTGDFNVSDLANSSGELDMSNNAVVTTGAGYIGKGTGVGAGAVGVVNLAGGLLVASGQNFQYGVYGTGTFNQSGGNHIVGAFPSIGRQSGGVGIVNVSGGTFNQTNVSAYLVVGEGGNGTLNVSGTGQVNAMRTDIGQLAGAVGTVNLNGGTLTTKQVFMGNGSASSTVNFNGGTLVAAVGATNDFMSGLNAATVQAGGAVIDSGANTITINQDLNTDYTGGGLTKLGSGSLSLGGYIYYIGSTVISQGTLNLTTHDNSGGNITTADGTTLGMQVLDYNGANSTASGLTVGATAAGAVLTFNLGSFGNPTAAPLNVSAGIVTLNGTTTINIDPNSSLSVGEIPLVSYGSLAGSGTLTLGAMPPGVFGYVTNDTSSSPNFIGLVVTAVYQPRWEGLAGGNWDVQVTTNWIDLGLLTPQFFFQGTKAIFDDSALGTTNINLVTTVSPGGVLVTNTLLKYTISGNGRISGGGGLTKLGNNVLTLSTTNNNYTGVTFIDEGGTLVSTVTNNLGTNSALIIANGTLSLAGNSQKFSAVNLTNGTIAATTATISAPIYTLDNGSVGAALGGGTLNTFGPTVDTVSVMGGNTYTGRTYLAGSTLSVPALANGGLASGIGMSSASPTNLVFAGGGLAYTGPTAVIDRGYTVQSGGSLTASGNLTLGGLITATAGNFIKSGNAALTYTALGTNVLSRGGGTAAYTVSAGAVILNGGAGAPGSYVQTNIVAGEIWVGYDQINAGSLVVSNSSLNISSWLAIDRGNGTVGSGSVVSLYNSLVNVGNCSLGYDNGIVGNSEFPVLNLNGNSRLADAGVLYIGESIGASARLNLSGNSALTVVGTDLIGRNAGATGAVVIAGSAVLTNNGASGYMSVGASGTGYLTLSNNATLANSRDENIGDVTGSSGTFNISDNATNLTPNLFVGKSGTSVGVVNQSGGYLGRLNPAPLVAYADWRIAGNAVADAATVGTFNMSGGVFEPFSNFQIGAYGTGFWNQSGGTANCGSFPVVARFPGSTATMNVSGGVFNQTATGSLLIIGEQGTGSLLVTNAGLVNCLGGLSIGHTATGNGVVNLGGGTLNTRIVQSPGATLGGSGILNLNGGLLQANANNTTFMTGLTAANVLAGANIDSGTNSITIGQALLDGGTGGGLLKLGTGALVLSGVNTYTGLSTISNGTLRINGSIPGSVAVKTNATIGGIGAIGGSVTLDAGATLSPGASVGSLTVNGNLSIAGNLFIEVDKTLSPALSNDTTVVTGTLNNIGTGTITVTNLGASALVAGDSFKLFSQPLIGGSALAIQPPLGTGIAWTNRLAIDGTIGVYATISLIPTNITVSVSGNTLTLTWPADHLGWILQSQTNGLNVGLSNNWFDVPSSGSSTQSVMTINPADPALFYRLRSP